MKKRKNEAATRLQAKLERVRVLTTEQVGAVAGGRLNLACSYISINENGTTTTDELQA